jgi:hypothetical protein
VTESEWLASNDTRAMIWALRPLLNLKHKRNARKLRLFGVACCQRIRHLIEAQPDAVLAVDLAEQYADGLVSEAEMLAVSARVNRFHSGAYEAHQAAAKVSSKNPTYVFRRGYYNGPDFLAAGAVWRSTLGEEIKARPDPPAQAKPRAAAGEAKRAEHATQAENLRCIFGNPFRPMGFDRQWRTTDAVGLAKSIYEDRAFAQLPLLADALTDAGVTDESLIAHCRSPGPHARGCWVVDLLLGKG